MFYNIIMINTALLKLSYKQAYCSVSYNNIKPLLNANIKMIMTLQSDFLTLSLNENGA